MKRRGNEVVLYYVHSISPVTTINQAEWSGKRKKEGVDRL
jgi:hypothetical protein